MEIPLYQRKMTLCNFIALEKTMTMQWIPFVQWIISEQGLMFVLFCW